MTKEVFKMKKLLLSTIALLSACIMCLSLAACSDQSNKDDTTDKETNNEQENKELTADDFVGEYNCYALYSVYYYTSYEPRINYRKADEDLIYKDLIFTFNNDYTLKISAGLNSLETWWEFDGDTAVMPNWEYFTTEGYDDEEYKNDPDSRKYDTVITLNGNIMILQWKDNEYIGAFILTKDGEAPAPANPEMYGAYKLNSIKQINSDGTEQEYKVGDTVDGEVLTEDYLTFDFAPYGILSLSIKQPQFDYEKSTYGILLLEGDGYRFISDIIRGSFTFENDKIIIVNKIINLIAGQYIETTYEYSFIKA